MKTHVPWYLEYLKLKLKKLKKNKIMQENKIFTYI